MLELLEAPDIRSQVAPITIERDHRMIGLGVFDDWDVELVNGILVEKISKSELHIYVVQVLFRLLSKFCPESDFLVRKEDPILIGDSEPEPDLSVIKGTLSQFKSSKPTTAQLVIEVAVTSQALDHAKANIYATGEVPEYWIVKPQESVIEVYRNPANGKYETHQEIPAPSTLESIALPGFRFNLEEYRS
jgi:Uma2 family endonuclease